MPARGGDVLINLKDPGEGRSARRSTPAWETQDSREDGFDRLFSQKNLDLGPEKKTCLPYIYCENKAGNWVSTTKKDSIVGCKKHVEKAKLHRRIIQKTARKTFISKWARIGIIDIYEISTTYSRIHHTLWMKNRANKGTMRGYTCEVYEGLQTEYRLKSSLSTYSG